MSYKKEYKLPAEDSPYAVLLKMNREGIDSLTEEQLEILARWERTTVPALKARRRSVVTGRFK
jgi:hypothetical protein